MTLRALVTYRWHDESDAPLVRHSRFSPIIADPAVVPPENAPDGLWHLYAHSAWGTRAARFPGKGDEVLLYYSARNDWPLARGRENIGLAIGTPKGTEGEPPEANA